MRYKRDEPPQCSHPGACTPVLTPPARSCSFPALSRVNQEKRTRETRNMSVSKILGSAVNVVEKVIVMIIDMLRDELESEDREKTTQYLKSKMEKAFQDYKDKMEALLEDFKNDKKFTQDEVQLLMKELEKKQGMKKEKRNARILEFRLKRKVRQLSRRIRNLEEDVDDWPETIKYELQVCRGALKNFQGMKEEDIALALVSLLKKNMRELSQKIETLEEDEEEFLETITYELQILRDDLEEKNQCGQGHCQEEFHSSEGRNCSPGQTPGKKWPSVCCMETEVDELSTQIQAMLLWKAVGL